MSQLFHVPMWLRRFLWIGSLLGLVLSFQSCSSVDGFGSGEPNTTFVADPHGNRFEVKYLPVRGVAVIEGDMVIGTAAQAEKHQIGMGPDGQVRIQGVGMRDRSTRWPRGVMVYEFGAYPNAREPILKAIQAINEAGLVRIQPRQRETDYIEIVNGVFDGDCRSWLGRKGGRQELWLGVNCLHHSVIMHEFGHAAGLVHEHSRSDRDAYVTVLWENVMPAMRSALEKGFSYAYNIGPYDYASVMHYGPYAWTRNGSPTIVPKKTGVRIGYPMELSAGDRQALYELYKHEF